MCGGFGMSVIYELNIFTAGSTVWDPRCTLLITDAGAKNAEAGTRPTYLIHGLCCCCCLFVLWFCQTKPPNMKFRSWGNKRPVRGGVKVIEMLYLRLVSIPTRHPRNIKIPAPVVGLGHQGTLVISIIIDLWSQFSFYTAWRGLLIPSRDLRCQHKPMDMCSRPGVSGGAYWPEAA